MPLLAAVVLFLYRCLFICRRLTLKHQPAVEKPGKRAKGALASPFSGLSGFLAAAGFNRRRRKLRQVQPVQPLFLYA
jgi:hypothetical protein